MFWNLVNASTKKDIWYHWLQLCFSSWSLKRLRSLRTSLGGSPRRCSAVLIVQAQSLNDSSPGYVHALRTFALSGSSLLWTWTLSYCEIDLVGGKWGELLAHPNLQVHKCPVPNQHSWRSLSDNQDTSSRLGLPQETRSCQRCRIRTESDWKCQRLIVAWDWPTRPRIFTEYT